MNKTLLLCLAISMMQLTALAQRESTGERLIHRKPEVARQSGCPRVYIGFSTGINNPVGLLGPQVDVAITPAFSVGTGIGISSWGYKTFFEGRYYFKECNRGWALGTGITYNTGLSGMPMNDAETVAGNQDIIVDLDGQVNFMFSCYHFFNLGRKQRNRFHLQAGYSIPLTDVGFTQVTGAPMSRNTHDALNAIAPGGLIIGLGFSFGAGSQ